LRPDCHESVTHLHDFTLEPVPDNVLEDYVNQLYRITAREEDYVNPTADGVLSWRSINSDMSDSVTEVENWQKRLHEVSTRRCARITRVVRWVGTEVRQFPISTEEENLENFLTNFESEVLDSQR
jgi:acyl carrier protein phosphodiesterase